MRDLISLIIALALSSLLIIASSVKTAADEDDITKIQYRMMFGNKHDTRIDDD